MARILRPYVRPATAEELYALHPEISVQRLDIGTMTVWSDESPRWVGQRILTLYASSRSNGGERGTALGITAQPIRQLRRLGGIGAHTRLTVPVEGGFAATEVGQAGAVKPDDALRIAQQGVELFDGLLSLSERERLTFSCMRGGNAKAYDSMRHPHDLRDALGQLPLGILVDGMTDGQILPDAFPIASRIFLPQASE